MHVHSCSATSGRTRELLSHICADRPDGREGHSEKRPRRSAASLRRGSDRKRVLAPFCSELTTLTKETFIPGFLERDEGERELPYAKYPWDGISGVRPFRALAATTTVGVY
jgi:hypothetical protein